MIKIIFSKFRILYKLISYNTPLQIYIKFLYTKILLFNFNYEGLARNFFINKKFNNFWFLDNLKLWEFLVSKFKFNKSPQSILEIGSYEGLSACYILERFSKNTKITCVDTWDGSDEHSDYNFKEIESNFNNNLKYYKKSVTKIKEKSLNFLTHNKKFFDLIYIDGSHLAEDVLIDALLSFRFLKKNGLMIFDDYFWFYYNDPKKNPAYGVNKFLMLKKNELKIIFVKYQVVIMKTV